MGYKRSRDDMEGKPASTDARPSPFMPMFEHFRAELDEHHDRRERIIKASRDITAASKKIIFTLQRVRSLAQPLPGHVQKGNKQYYDKISEQLGAVVRDLQGLNTYRYARQISGGCQEWMESASFQHYLEYGEIISYEDAVKQLRSISKPTPKPQDTQPDLPIPDTNAYDPPQLEDIGVDLTPEDYILGIYDMTGELMRFAITTMATSGALPTLPNSSLNRNVLTDMRNLRSALEALETGSGPFSKDTEKKAEVMRQSVEKVEKALYGLTVRGAERPRGWVPELEGGRGVEVEG
ncbi:Translin-associated protein X [Teratosphaeria destructans]|uniref:Translin-associated protein X n=1 Tax=Teratosphaeria destructans TaxID=418781 RepID=A0A9W7SN81_9PEZI|nr:Translin-associated protein X [Teratosphaeria destructans]